MNDASQARCYAAMLVYDTSSIQRDLRFLLGSFRTSVHVWGWRVEGPGRVGRLVTARTGWNRGVAKRGVQAVSQRSTVSSVSRCTAVLRVRAYVTLVLGGREGLRGALVTEVALHRFARRVVSLIRACGGRISFFRTNTPRRSRSSLLFLFPLAESCLPCVDTQCVSSAQALGYLVATVHVTYIPYRMEGGCVLRGQHVFAAYVWWVWCMKNAASNLA